MGPVLLWVSHVQTSGDDLGAMKLTLEELAAFALSAVREVVRGVMEADASGSGVLGEAGPTDEEIELQARYAATVLVASWSEYLRRVLGKRGGLELGEDLLPRGPSGVFQGLLRDRFFQALEGLGLGRDDAIEILSVVSRRLFEGSSVVELPSGVVLSEWKRQAYP